MWTSTRVGLAVLGVAGLVGLTAGCNGSVSEEISQREKNVWARAQVDRLRIQLKVYKSDLGQFPTSDQGLGALAAGPATQPAAASRPAGGRAWRGPYVQADELVDPWGRSYQYRIPAEHQDRDPFDLWSAGPDGKDGTPDDIANWSRRPAVKDVVSTVGD